MDHKRELARGIGVGRQQHEGETDCYMDGDKGSCCTEI